jgi:putative copper export protein
VELAYRSLHLLAAVVWGGGLVMLAVVAGSASRALSDVDRSELFHVVGRRFLIVSGAAAAVLFATGLELATDRFGSLSAIDGAPDGGLVIAKTAIFIVLLGLALIHSFVLAPRLRELKLQLSRGAADPAIERSRRTVGALSGLVHVSLLLGTVTIFVLAADLVS